MAPGSTSTNNPSPHVAIYRNELLPRSETFIEQQARALRRWRPILVGRRLTPNGLRLDGLDVRLTGRWHGRLTRVAHKLRILLDLPDSSLVKALLSLRVDLVHVHFGTEATDIWPSVKRTGLPMLVTLHGYDVNIHKEWWEAGGGGMHRRAYPRRLLQMARHPDVRFLAVSKAIRDRAVEFGIAAQKVTVAYVGVDTGRFKPSGLPLDERRKRILFVGRMVEKKAPLLLVRAFADVKKAVPDAELVMIGDGPLLPNAKQLARELGLPVEFPGAQDSDAVLDQLHQARVFCLPSIVAGNGDAEGFGLVLLEAQACGVPAITSARGGAEEGLIEGETGSRFKEKEIATLVRLLIELLTDEDLYVSQSKAASTFVRKSFDLSDQTRKLEAHYDRTLMCREGTEIHHD